MTTQPCTVSVIRFPETSDLKQQRNFMREVDGCLNFGRPCIVIDCSKVRELDRNVLLLLLRCLEEAMKRHGDVRLATFPRQAQSMLAAMGFERLFKTYDQVADAVNSYHRVNPLLFESSLGDERRRSADAA